MFDLLDFKEYCCQVSHETRVNPPHTASEQVGKEQVPLIRNAFTAHLNIVIEFFGLHPGVGKCKKNNRIFYMRKTKGVRVGSNTTKRLRSAP
jgi:hypothetical protein